MNLADSIWFVLIVMGIEFVATFIQLCTTDGEEGPWSLGWRTLLTVAIMAVLVTIFSHTAGSIWNTPPWR